MHSLAKHSCEEQWTPWKNNYNSTVINLELSDGTGRNKMNKIRKQIRGPVVQK